MTSGRPRVGTSAEPVDQGRWARRWLPGTIAVRWCAGCERLMGFQLWRRTSRPFVHTHGLCSDCLQKAEQELEALQPASEPGWRAKEPA
jgi:hypothetical protein